MADPFEDRLRRALEEEARRVAVPPSDPETVRGGIERPDRAAVFGVAAGILAVALVAFGFATLAGRDGSVVLDQPGGGVGPGPSGSAVVGSEAPGSEAVPVPATVEELEGRVFESVGQLPGAPDPNGTMTLQFRVPPSAPATSAPQHESLVEVRTDPGCNRAGGGYQLDSDGTLTLKDYGSTAIGCPGVREAMDAWVASILQGRPRLLLTGDRLSVMADGSTIHLADVGVQDCEEVIQDVVNDVLEVVSTLDVDAFLTGELVLPDENGVELGGLKTRLEQTGCTHQAVAERVAERLYLAEGEQLRDETVEGQTRRRILRYLADSFLTGETLGVPRPSVRPGVPGETVTPAPITATPVPMITALPPSPVPDAGDVWCGAAGLVGAVAGAGGDLSAVCADGTDVQIAPGPGWRHVSVGPDAIVAQQEAADGNARTTTFAVADGQAESLEGVRLGTFSEEGRLAFVHSDDVTVEAETTIDQPSFVATAKGGAVTDLSWDRSGRWLLATVTGGDGSRRVLAWDVTAPDSAPTVIDSPGLLAAAGEIDTPDNVVMLASGEDGLVLEATFLGQPDSPTLFGHAETDLSPQQFTDGAGAFVEPVGLLAFDADSLPPWFTGNSIGWLVGNGDALWYVDGVETRLVRGGVRDFSAAP